MTSFPHLRAPSDQPPRSSWATIAYLGIVVLIVVGLMGLQLLPSDAPVGATAHAEVSGPAATVEFHAPITESWPPPSAEVDSPVEEPPPTF